MSSRHSSFWIPVLLLLVFAAWRVLAIPDLHMRDDEQIAFGTTAGTLIETLDYQANQDIQAPLWFALFWGWQQVAGATEFTARVFSLLWAMLTAAMTYRLGARWFGVPRFGAFALIALMFSTYAFIFASEIRPYALVMFLATLCMAAFARWLDRPSGWHLVAYGVTVGLALYAHYFLAFLFAAQGLFILGIAVKRRAWRLFPLWLGGMAVGIVLWLPQAPIFIHQLQILRQIAETTAMGGVGIGTASTAEPRTWATVQRLLDVSTNGQVFLTGAILVIGSVILWRRRAWWLALAWGIAVPAIALVANLFLDVYSQRYVSYAVVGLALAVGAGLAAIPRPALRAGALVGFIGLSAVGFGWNLPDRIPYRYLFGELSADAQPGDVIWFSGTDPNENLLRWQRGAYLPPELPVVSAPMDDWPRRVWFVTGDLFNEQVQADFRALEATHPAQQSYGDCTREWCFVVQLMEAPPLSEPIAFAAGEDAVPFRGLTVDDVSTEAVEARLWWQVPESGLPPALDYSIGLHLIDRDGRLVAQSDGPIQHYGQEVVQTSTMDPGRIYMDVRRLELPPALAPGDYRLTVVVYQPWDGTRLTLPDGSDYWEFPVTFP